LLSTLVILLIATLVASGCGSAKPAENSTAKPAESLAPKVVNIGATIPLSGGAALFGQNIVEGLNMGIDEINSKGGVTVGGQKYTFKLVTLDGQWAANLDATNGRRLSTENKCPIVFETNPGGGLAMEQYNQNPDTNFLIVGYNATDDVISQGNKLIWRMVPPLTSYPAVFSKMAIEKYGKKLALVADQGDYAKTWTTEETKAWQALGGTVTGDFSADYNKETDFSTFVTKALATKPDVLFIGGPSQPTARVIKAARQMGFKGGFIMLDQAHFDELDKLVTPEELNGTSGSLAMTKYNSVGMPKFIAAYKAKFGATKDPTWDQTFHYNAIKMIADGMEKAQSVTDPTKIFAGIKALCPYKGEGTPFVETTKIDDRGSTEVPGIGIMFENGKYGEPFIVK